MVNLQPIKPEIPKEALMSLVARQEKATDVGLGAIGKMNTLIGGLEVSEINNPKFQEYVNTYNNKLDQYTELLYTNPNKAVTAARELQILGNQLLQDASSGTISKFTKPYAQYKAWLGDVKKDKNVSNEAFALANQYAQSQFNLLNEDPSAQVNVSPKLFNKPDMMEQAHDVLSKVKTDEKGGYIDNERINTLVDEIFRNNLDNVNYYQMLNSFDPESTEINEQRYNDEVEAVKRQAKLVYSKSAKRESDSNIGLPVIHTLEKRGDVPNLQSERKELIAKGEKLTRDFLLASQAGQTQQAQAIADRYEDYMVDINNITNQIDYFNEQALSQLTPSEQLQLINPETKKLRTDAEFNEIDRNLKTDAMPFHYGLNTGMLNTEMLNTEMYNNPPVIKAYDKFKKKRKQLMEESYQSSTKLSIIPTKEMSEKVSESVLYSLKGAEVLDSKGRLIKEPNFDTDEIEVKSISSGNSGNIDVEFTHGKDTFIAKLGESRSKSLAESITNSEYGNDATTFAEGILNNTVRIYDQVNTIGAPVGGNYKGPAKIISLKGAGTDGKPIDYKFNIVLGSNNNYIIESLTRNGEVINLPSDGINISTDVNNMGNNKNAKTALVHTLTTLVQTRTPEVLLQEIAKYINIK